MWALIFLCLTNVYLCISIQIFNPQLLSFALKRHVNKHILDEAFLTVKGKKQLR